MQKDRKIGSGHWRGCHSFKDIVCDGDAVFEGKRNGCLRMGGTYWYYVCKSIHVGFVCPC